MKIITAIEIVQFEIRLKENLNENMYFHSI